VVTGGVRRYYVASRRRSTVGSVHHMKDDRGTPITDTQLIDRVAQIGAVVVVRGPVEAADFPTWRRELRRAARARGLRLSVLRRDEFIVVHNPDHVVTEAQRRVAFAKIAAAVTLEATPVAPPTPSRPTLRIAPLPTKSQKRPRQDS
jgi:hypothetical protein